MMLSKEQLQELEDFGYAQFSIRKIAIVMKLNFDELKLATSTPGTDAYNAYEAGKLAADFDARITTFDLAKRGSVQALEIARQYIDQLKQEEAE